MAQNDFKLVTYFEDKTLKVIFERRPFVGKHYLIERIVIPDDEVLDAMSDIEYNAFSEFYKNHHLTHWPSSCCYIPRRKTKAERQKAAEESERFWAAAEESERLWAEENVRNAGQK